MADEFTVVDVPAQHRYEIHDGESVAGYAAYTLTDEQITFTHTVIQPEYGGQGLGSQLIRWALDDVVAKGGLRIVPRCPFTAAYLQRHHDYDELVDWPA